MPDTLPESERFNALFAEVETVLKRHTLGLAPRGRRVLVVNPMTGGRSLYVEIVIDDNMPGASDDTGPWWDWTPTT